MSLTTILKEIILGKRESPEQPKLAKTTRMSDKEIDNIILKRIKERKYYER